MESLLNLIETNIPLYYLLSFFNCITGVLTCVLASVLITKKIPKYRLIPGIISVILCAVAAIIRIRSGDNKTDILYTVGIILLFLLNYICIFIFYPGKKCIVPFLIVTGLVFTDALKYIILMFMSFDYFGNSDIPELLVELMIGIFALAVILTFLIIRSKKSTDENREIKPDILLYTLVLTSISVFIATLAIFGINYSEGTRFTFLIALLNIPLVGGTVLYAVSKLLKAKLSEENYRRRLDMQLQHFRQMEIKNEEMRVFRHDFKKKLRPAVMYLSDGNTENAIEILSEFTEELEASRPRYNSGNFMFDTVLECQQQIAEQNKASIILTQGSAFPPEGIEPNDIYTIFPNALDNAIEACAKFEGRREITISSRIAGDTVYVSIKNPCVTDVAKNTKLETSKKDKELHGYGMKSIAKAASKYGEDNVEYFTKDGQFIIRISLKYINN